MPEERVLPKTQLGQIEQGTEVAFTGLGRSVVGDNIIDQFVELNATDALLQAFAFQYASAKELCSFSHQTAWLIGRLTFTANLNWGEKYGGSERYGAFVRAR